MPFNNVINRAASKKFVIFAAPRTGSNLLCTLLHSHPDVLCHHEVFNPEGVFIAQALRDTGFSLGDIAERDTSPLGFLQRVWANHNGHACLGFKMTHKQQPEVFQSLCEDDRVHKIVLRREAKVKPYVSRLIAEKTGVWEDYGNGDIRELTAVDVNSVRLLEAIQFDENYYRELDRRIRGPRVDVVYEHLFEQETQSRLLQSLGLSNIQLVASSRHQNPYPLRHLISNFDELQNQLLGTAQCQALLNEIREH